MVPSVGIKDVCRSRRHGFGRSFAFLVALVLLLTASVLEAGDRKPDRGKPIVKLGALITMSATGDPDTQAAIWLAALSAAAAGTEDLDSFKLALVAIADSYEGATGRTTFDAAGDRADAAYDVWAIEEENGQYVWKLVAP